MKFFVHLAYLAVATVARDFCDAEGPDDILITFYANKKYLKSRRSVSREVKQGRGQVL